MIDRHHFIYIIEEKYSQLDESEKKNLDNILCFLIELTEKPHDSHKNYLRDVERYLSAKLRRDLQNEEIPDIFALKALICRRNKYSEHIHTVVISIIWDLLLIMSNFKGDKEFYNFIGYFLKIELPDSNLFMSRRHIVNAYRQQFETLPEEIQRERMRNLAISSLIAAKPSDLRKLNDSFNL